VNRAVIGIGGNVGDVAQTLRAALAELDRDAATRVVVASSLYRTAPIGGVEQDDFLNAAALLETTRGPSELLRLLLDIETAHDLDLLWYERVVVAAPGLIVPHPRLHERRFALQPLVEVAPFAADAEGVPYSDLLALLPVTGVTVVGDPSLVYDPS
jgi:2-amino-4-hydroxy-6-hydroxymethyldihydropteridine diphosphokinase